MHWFFIALVGPILYSVANHTDKYLLSRYLKNGEVGAIAIFSSIFSVFALPVVLFIHPQVFNVTFFQGIALALNDMLAVVAILLYFYALNKDEASFVVPFYQTIPIFAFILGYFILGETITKTQVFSSLVIILGAFFLSFEIGLSKVRFKKEVVFFMLGASLLYAINGVIFKLIAVEEGLWPSTFWGFVGKIIIGLCFLIFIPKYRFQFFQMVQRNKVAILSINSISETLFIVAEVFTQYAFLLAPVTLVLLVNSFQPLFVLLIGILLSIFFPKISQESMKKGIIFQKIIGISLIIVGSFFVST